MIEAKYVLSAAELMRGVDFHLRRKLKLAQNTPIFAALFLILFVLIYRNAQLSVLPWLLIFIIAGFGLVYPWLLKLAIKRSFRKLPDFNKEMFFAFAEDHLFIKTADGESRRSWDSLSEAIIGQDGMLIYLQPALFHWLPASAFKPPADFARAVELMTRKIKKVKNVSKSAA